MTPTRFASLVLALWLGMAATGPARAAFIFTLTVEGPGSVRVMGSGSLDLTGLTLKEQTGSDLSLVIGGLGVIYRANGKFDVYTGLTGPANFGFSGTDPIFATDATGDNVGLFGQGQLIVPAGYVSGTPLSAMLLLDKPLIAIGSIGDYVYSWTGDSFTVKVPAEPGVLPVPAPASALVLGAGLFALAVARRVRG